MSTADVVTAKPREVAGRDMIARLNMQFQAAAYAALAILEDADTDRVYCDWHDDYVVRKVTAAGPAFHFYQVKTKRKANEQWSTLQVFALKKRQGDDAKSLEQIESSFAGKLFVHSITFGDRCHGITFLTNIQFEDELLELVEELRSGAWTSAHAKFLTSKFPAIFSKAAAFTDVEMRKVFENFRLEAAKHIGFDLRDFAMAARDAIHRYSEIDLTQAETSGIAQGLIELVHRKSHSEVLSGMTADELGAAVGVSLDDLLDVLSISPDAYNVLRAGGDPYALKHASVIQRTMKAVGASDQAIEFLSQKKVEWDIWLRNARHSIPDYELNLVLEMIAKAQLSWSRGAYTLIETDGFVRDLLSTPQFQRFPSLTIEVVLGGIMAALVRQKNQ